MLTAKYVSERSGSTTVVVENQGENHNKLDPVHLTLEERLSVGQGTRQVLTPDEVLTMAKDNSLNEIIIQQSQPILMAEKFDYTRDPESKNWKPFAMYEFNPDDDFWKIIPEGQEGQADKQPADAEPEQTGSSQPAIPTPPKAPKSPDLGKEPEIPEIPEESELPDDLWPEEELDEEDDDQSPELLSPDACLDEQLEAEWREMQAVQTAPGQYADAPKEDKAEPTHSSLGKLRPPIWSSDDESDETASSLTGGLKL